MLGIVAYHDLKFASVGRAAGLAGLADLGRARGRVLRLVASSQGQEAIAGQAASIPTESIQE